MNLINYLILIGKPPWPWTQHNYHAKPSGKQKNKQTYIWLYLYHKLSFPSWKRTRKSQSDGNKNFSSYPPVGLWSIPAGWWCIWGCLPSSADPLWRDLPLPLTDDKTLQGWIPVSGGDQNEATNKNSKLKLSWLKTSNVAPTARLLGWIIIKNQHVMVKNFFKQRVWFVQISQFCRYLVAVQISRI